MTVYVCVFLQLGIILNDMHHMSQVFDDDQWPKIIPTLSEEEANDETNARLVKEIDQVMADFRENVAQEKSHIIKQIVNKVRTSCIPYSAVYRI